MKLRKTEGERKGISQVVECIKERKEGSVRELEGSVKEGGRI